MMVERRASVPVAPVVAIVGTRYEQSAAVVRAPLLPAQVRRGRERFRKPLVGAVRIEDLWAPRLAFVHDAAVLELFDECLFASAHR